MNNSKPTSDSTQVSTISRRKVLLGATYTGAFAALVAGKPVFGAKTLCSPSGFHSGNLSGIEPEACNGRSPGYWKMNPGAWAVTSCVPGFCRLKNNGHCANNSQLVYTDPNSGQQATKYKDVFGFWNTPYDNMYMMDYLRNIHPTDPRHTKPIVWHLTAALLNAKAGISGFVLTPEEVKEMWKQLVVNGSFQYVTPSGLVLAWSGEGGLEDFLTSTYHDGVLV